MTPIVGSPQLEVGALRSSRVHALASGLMQPCEVHVDESRPLSISLRTLVIGAELSFLNIRGGVRAVDEELLGDTLGLGNYVSHEHRVFRYFNRVPCFPEVPRELHLGSRLVVFCCDDQGTVIADVVDVVAGMRRFEGQATVTRDVEGFLDMVRGKGAADVSCCNDDSDRRLCRVDRCMAALGRVHLQVQRAALLFVAVNDFSFRSGCWGLDTLPFASLVVCDDSTNFLLYFRGSDASWNSENFTHRLLLLGVRCLTPHSSFALHFSLLCYYVSFVKYGLFRFA